MKPHQSKYLATVFLLSFFLLITIVVTERNHQGKRERLPSSGGIQKDCVAHNNCPFLVIGHRGAPFDEPENTLESFSKAMELGANALEIDLVVTRDGKVVVYHDFNPDNLVSLIRQSGLEGLPFIPYVPDLGSPYRRDVNELSYNEFVVHYGLAKSKGVLGDVFTNGERLSVQIPTLEEFLEWSKDQDELHLVVLDIKIPKEHSELLTPILTVLEQWQAQLNYSMIVSTTEKSLFVKSRMKLLNRKFKSSWRGALDFEAEGAYKSARQNGDKNHSMMIGKTILRSWSAFWKELNDLLNWRESNYQQNLYPVIAWTFDQQERMYQLVGTDVDGVITNRPRELRRIKDRHFQDHRLLGHFLLECAQENRGRRSWNFCADGNEVRPLWPIGNREFTEWVRLKDFNNQGLSELMGIGFGNKRKVDFQGEMNESGNSWIWYMPYGGGKVIVKRAMEEYAGELFPVVIDFKQADCNDGFLNYDCEYALYLSYLNRETGIWTRLTNNSVRADSSFYYMTHVPAEATAVKIDIYETDDGKIMPKSRSTNIIPVRPRVSVVARSGDKTFKGQLNFYAYPRAIEDTERLRNQKRQRFSIEYRQKSCNDGPLNWDCEYRLWYEYSYDGQQFLNSGQRAIAFDSNGQLQGSVPKGVKVLRVHLEETDDGRLAHSRAKAIVDLDFIEQSHRQISSMDNKTFSGLIRLNKHLSYAD